VDGLLAPGAGEGHLAGGDEPAVGPRPPHLDLRPGVRVLPRRHGLFPDIGRELGAAVVPVGLAWRRFLRAHGHLALHDRDQSHPTLAGSYLAACVFLAVLFGESPVGVAAEVAGLSGKDLALLQQAAWQACQAPSSEGGR
jgi:hypothetical protein